MFCSDNAAEIDEEMPVEKINFGCCYFSAERSTTGKNCFKSNFQIGNFHFSSSLEMLTHINTEIRIHTRTHANTQAH